MHRFLLYYGQTLPARDKGESQTFEKLFLDSTDLQKFTLYRSIKTLDEQNFTINDLATKLNLSYQQAYTIFREMLADIEASSGELGALSDKRSLMRDNFSLTIDEYRLTLMEQSIQFQFVDYLLQAPNPTVDRFCQDRFISRSTLTRKTAALREFLQPFGLKLSFTVPGFVGDERRIRQFIFYFYWLSFHGVRWPITAIQPQHLSTDYQAQTHDLNTELVDLQNMLFWGICRLRIVHGHVLEDWPNYDALFSGGDTTGATLYTKDLFPTLSDSQLKGESQFYRFFQMSRFRYSPRRESWLEMYATIMGHDNPVKTYVTQLGQFLDKHCRQDSPTMVTDDAPLMTNIIRIVSAYYLFDGPVVSAIDFYDQANNLYPLSACYQRLLAFHDRLPDKEFAFLKQNSDELARLLTFLLVSKFKLLTWGDTVECIVLLDEGSLAAHHVLNFLENMSMVHVMTPEEDISHADVIVSFVNDVPLTKPKNCHQRVVNWHSHADFNDMIRLFTAVKASFLHKLGYTEPYPYLQI